MERINKAIFEGRNDCMDMGIDEYSDFNKH